MNISSVNTDLGHVDFTLKILYNSLKECGYTFPE